MLNEEGLELMTIDMLKDLGYEYEPGETIGRDYSDVILEPNLTMSLYKINRNLKDETIAEAVRIIKNLDQNNLVNNNKVFIRAFCEVRNAERLFRLDRILYVSKIK